MPPPVVFQNQIFSGFCNDKTAGTGIPTTHFSHYSAASGQHPTADNFGGWQRSKSRVQIIKACGLDSSISKMR